MHSKQTTVFVLVFLLASLGHRLAHAQTPSILESNEAAQREFLTRYLAAVSPEGPSAPSESGSASRRAAFERLGQNPSSDARWLVTKHEWAVEMILRKIQEVRSRPKHDGYDVFVLTQLIKYSDRSDAFEIISSRLKDDPDFEDLISSVLSHSISSPREYTGRLWYRALESENPVVRDVASKYLAPVFIDPPPPYSRVWASALVDRYGHSPTALEMATDPIFLVAKERNPEKAERTRTMMLGLAEKEYLRRQLPAPVKPQ
jgi:hypothetical protein